MKSTGIVRRVDELGRVVIPMEMRRTMRIKDLDPIEFFTEGDKIILRKYSPGCIFCDNVDNLHTFNGKPVCATCISKIKEG